jgi:peptide/nickel transport system substrate-binding protein
VQVRDQWQAGRMEYTLQSWVVIFPQFVDPSPAIVAEVPFRRALLHAIDRQQMADTLLRGLVPIAHSVLNPNEPEYIAVEREIVRYDYDPRRAAQLIEGLGYAKGSDGVYRDAAGQRLEFEVRTSTNDLQIKAQAAAADAWRRLGVEVEPAVIPQERQVDTEYAASFSGFQLFRQPDGVNALNRYYGSKAALPANSFRATGNHARYVNPEFDALLDSYYTTVPWQPRLQALGRVVHHMTDELIAMGLFYDAEPNLIANRLREVGVRYGGRATQTWNAHLWDVQGGGA